MDSSALYRQLFAASPNAILLIDPGTQRVIEFNDTACEQLGYTRTEFGDLSLADHDAAQSLGQIAEKMRAALHEGKTEFETLLRTKAGEIRHVHVWAKTVDVGGRVGIYTILRDITGQKLEEDALRKNQEFLVQSQRIAHLGNWMVDLETRKLTWSDELYRIYGVSPDAFIPTLGAFVALIHPDDQPAMRLRMSSGPSEKSPDPIEFRVIRPDGTVRVIEGGGEVRVNSENKPIYWIGTAQDITERKKAEDAQRRLLELFDRTSRVAKVGGWELEVETQALRWTDEVYRIHEVDSAVRPSVDDAIQFYAPEQRAIIAGAVQAAIDTGTPFDLELPLLTAHGRRIWVRAQGSAERREGKTIRVYGAFQDISERRRTEELQRLQSAALVAAANGIVITDREGMIEWVNPAFSELTGYTVEEALGKNPRDLVKSGKHDHAFFADFWATIVAGRTWRGEVVNRRKDGSLYTENQTVTPILDGSGAVTHFVAIKKDVTERLQLEAQLRQAQKMESVGRLAGGIAHDFNNLLTVINGLSELVLEQVGQDDPVHADVEEIHRAGERAAALTGQLLAFSRQQVLAPQVMNLNVVVTEMESLLRRLLGEDIDLMVAPAPDLGNIKADPGQIGQVIANLMVNARDAMPRGGQLTIETQNVTIDQNYAWHHAVAPVDGHYVMLAVSDSGIGMDEATRARIFEPFFTTKEPGKGTGLGLSTVYGIVKQSQGFIWVYSELGRGTSFKIYLPQVFEAAGTAHPGSTAGAIAGTETILLVEDNVGLRKMATRFLEPAGYTVVGAATGEEALSLAASHQTPVHVLLSDIVMPGMSGPQLAEQLAQVRPGIKVLYMSGYTNDMIIRHGVLDAQVSFLSKPFTAETLLRKLREVLDS